MKSGRLAVRALREIGPTELPRDPGQEAATRWRCNIPHGACSIVSWKPAGEESSGVDGDVVMVWIDVLRQQH